MRADTEHGRQRCDRDNVPHSLSQKYLNENYRQKGILNASNVKKLDNLNETVKLITKKETSITV